MYYLDLFLDAEFDINFCVLTSYINICKGSRWKRECWMHLTIHVYLSCRSLVSHRTVYLLVSRIFTSLQICHIVPKFFELFSLNGHKAVHNFMIFLLNLAWHTFILLKIWIVHAWTCGIQNNLILPLPIKAISLKVTNLNILCWYMC